MTIETDCDNPRVVSLRKALTHSFNMGWASDTTLRTMTIWSDEEKLKANIDEVRAAAASAVGMTTTGGMMGALAVELD